MHSTCDVVDSSPHGIPSDANAIAAHAFAPTAPAQYKPSVPLQPGIVPPHAAPTSVAATWQVPDDTAVERIPVHARPLPQGEAVLHVAALAP